MILVDSNVLVYAHDPADQPKQHRAAEVLDLLIRDADAAALSVQCLTEFFNSVRRKIPQPLSHETAIREVDEFTRTCTILDLTAPAVLEGCRATEQYQLSFWDALIWAVAKLNDIPIVLTEDGQHERVIEGVRYLNPFHADFDAAVLGV